MVEGIPTLPALVLGSTNFTTEKDTDQQSFYVPSLLNIIIIHFDMARERVVVAAPRRSRFPFKNPQDKKRRGRHRAHFTFEHQEHRSMEVTQSTQGHDKQAKGHSHEAQMIPGIQRPRTFGFPNSIITKLRYCDSKTLTSTTGSLDTDVFTANGIFDPDITDTGHQPMWRDNYASIYNAYTVLGSKITFTVCTPATEFYSRPCMLTLNGDDNATVSTTLSTRMESNNGTSYLMGPNGNGYPQLTSTFEPLLAFGVDTKDDGASLTAVGSNPNEQWYWAFAMTTLDASTYTVYYKVEIEYTVKFAELVSQVQN